MAQIKHRHTQEIIFEIKDKNINETILIAIEKNIALNNTDLSNLNLNGINLENVNLRGVDFSYSDFSSIDHGAFPVDGGVYHDYVQSDLSNADLSEATLIGTNLNDTKLFNVNFTKANLRDADLSLSDLRNCNFNSASLTDTDLTGTHLDNASFENANLYKANLEGAYLNETSLVAAHLSKTDFTESYFNKTDFLNATLYHTIFGLTDLSSCKNLDKTTIENKCIIDFETLSKSPHISRTFLQNIGLQDLFIDYLPDLCDPKALNLYPVFLSYSSDDKIFSRHLYRTLKEKGVLVWFDEKKIKTGDDIFETISTNIKTYDKMILVCSKASLSNSWWVNREIKEARKKEEEYFKKTGKDINIILPISIDDYVYKDWNSPNKNYITSRYIEDFSNWRTSNEFNQKISKLVTALNANQKPDQPYSLL